MFTIYPIGRPYLLIIELAAFAVDSYYLGASVANALLPYDATFLALVIIDPKLPRADPIPPLLKKPIQLSKL